MKKALVFTSIVAVLSAPFTVFAQNANVGYVTGWITAVQGIVTSLPPILIGIAVVLFLWGLVKFVFAAEDEEARKGGRSLMIWGIIAILVMVSLWGIIALLGNIFQINVANPPDLNPLQ